MKVYACVELTPREEKFVLAIACYGYAPTRAATEAGYTKASARLLIARPHIRAALDDISHNVTTCIDKFERGRAKRQEKAAA